MSYGIYEYPTGAGSVTLTYNGGTINNTNGHGIYERGFGATQSATLNVQNVTISNTNGAGIFTTMDTPAQRE